MKHIFSIILCFGFFTGLYGQVRISGSSGELPQGKVTPQDTLDFSKMRVQYQVWVMKDILHPEKLAV